MRPALAIQPDDIAKSFRHAMRYCGSTVTILATEHGRRFGMVATAVMSVTLEPPTLAVCINRTTSLHDPLLARGVFSVNILSQADEAISRRFSVLSGEARFEAGTWQPSDAVDFQAIPTLASAQSVLLCRVRSAIPQGTHTLILAEVETVQERSGSPLLYCDGGYGSFVTRRNGSPAAIDDRLALCN